MEVAFSQHYRRTSNDPSSLELSLQADKESSYVWERNGESVVEAIMNAGDFNEECAVDIQRILEERYYNHSSKEIGEETEFDSDSHYEQKTIGNSPWDNEWLEFERRLKTETRFFSRFAADHLNDIFEYLKELQKANNIIIVDAGPETEIPNLYRARVFQSDEKLKIALSKADQHLGPPPSSLAATGRMNAQGISVFYGATASKVALAEVRPPVGSKVVVANFNIIRKIKLLDLSRLKSLKVSGSIFDTSYMGRLEKAFFLGKLADRMTMPIMPDDKDFEYLATQVLADFLASQTDPEIHGIIYPSAQTVEDSLNVVLFNKVSRVEIIDPPVGTKTEVYIGEFDDFGSRINYSVIEEVPGQTKNSQKETHKSEAKGFFAPILATDPDKREITLRIELDTINVHLIKSVEFKVDEYKVDRYRWEKPDSNDSILQTW